MVDFLSPNNPSSADEQFVCTS